MMREVVRRGGAVSLDDSTRIPFAAVACERGGSDVGAELSP
jgi:hypothetical protein